MPAVDGLTVTRVLRSERNRVPILMLTARTTTGDRVAGLDAGADDYLPKPFDLEELLARIRALLRRSQAEPDDDRGAGDGSTSTTCAIDTGARRVWRAGAEIELTKTEYDLLELLVRNAGIVLDHSTIYERIWNYDFGPDSKNLAVYIGYLRRKTEIDGRPRLVHTVRGVGYIARDGRRDRLDEPALEDRARRWQPSPPSRRWPSVSPATARPERGCTTRSTDRWRSTSPGRWRCPTDSASTTPERRSRSTWADRSPRSSRSSSSRSSTGTARSRGSAPVTRCR